MDFDIPPKGEGLARSKVTEKYILRTLALSCLYTLDNIEFIDNSLIKKNSQKVK
jgi:hypothetical protein